MSDTPLPADFSVHTPIGKTPLIAAGLLNAAQEGPVPLAIGWYDARTQTERVNQVAVVAKDGGLVVVDPESGAAPFPEGICITCLAGVPNPPPAVLASLENLGYTASGIAAQRGYAERLQVLANFLQLVVQKGQQLANATFESFTQVWGAVNTLQSDAEAATRDLYSRLYNAQDWSVTMDARMAYLEGRQPLIEASVTAVTEGVQQADGKAEAAGNTAQAAGQLAAQANAAASTAGQTAGAAHSDASTALSAVQELQKHFAEWDTRMSAALQDVRDAFARDSAALHTELGHWGQHAEAAKSAIEALSARVEPLESLPARVVPLEALSARVEPLEALSARLQALDALSARVEALEAKPTATQPPAEEPAPGRSKKPREAQRSAPNPQPIDVDEGDDSLSEGTLDDYEAGPYASGGSAARGVTFQEDFTHPDFSTEDAYDRDIRLDLSDLSSWYPYYRRYGMSSLLTIISSMLGSPGPSVSAQGARIWREELEYFLQEIEEVVPSGPLVGFSGRPSRNGRLVVHNMHRLAGTLARLNGFGVSGREYDLSSTFTRPQRMLLSVLEDVRGAELQRLPSTPSGKGSRSRRRRNQRRGAATPTRSRSVSPYGQRTRSADRYPRPTYGGFNSHGRGATRGQSSSATSGYRAIGQAPKNGQAGPATRQ